MQPAQGKVATLTALVYTPGLSVVEAIQKRNETWLAKKPVVCDPYIFNRAEAAMGSLSREVTCKIQEMEYQR